jgi:ATP-dependent DNA helicase RecG
MPMLKIADLERDAGLLDTAREVAQQMLREAPQMAEKHLNFWLGQAGEYVKV